MTTNLFVIANVKQLQTGGSFRILLPFFWTSWCVGVLNSTIFISFHKWIEFSMILEGLQNFGGGFEHPNPPLQYATVSCKAVDMHCCFETDVMSLILIFTVECRLTDCQSCEPSIHWTTTCKKSYHVLSNYWLQYLKAKVILQNTLFQIYVICLYYVITCLFFCINVWIYCWNHVKELGKFRINLVHIIISVFACYHSQAIS